MTYNLTQPVLVTTENDTDAKFRVSDDAGRDSLITSRLIKKGHIIFHETDDIHYKLKTYPTPGSIVGVVWEVFGTGSVDQSDIDASIESLKDGVAPAGDTLKKLYDLIQGVISVDKTYDDIPDRDANTGEVSNGEYVFVIDASADPTVTAGWAIYRWDGASYSKIMEQEGLDIVLTALAITYDNSTSGLVASNVKAAIDELQAKKAAKNTTINSGSILDIVESGFFTVTEAVADMPVAASKFMVILSKYEPLTQKMIYAYSIADGSFYRGIATDASVFWQEVTGSSSITKAKNNTSGNLSFDLDTFDIDLGTTLIGNVTQFEITGGRVRSDPYRIKIKQDLVGGRTFKWAEDHALNQAYAEDDLALFPDNVVYICVVAHTSDIADHYADIDVNWVKRYFFAGNVLPVMSEDPLKVDNLIIEIQIIGQYLITPQYDVHV